MPKASAYTKFTPTLPTIPPSLYQPYTIPYTHIYTYITYTYNNNVLCAYTISYVCCANLLEVYKTPLSFSSLLSLLMKVIMRAC